MSLWFARSLRVALAIGRVTFNDVVRDKVLYNILVCAFLLFGISFLASRLTFAAPERILLDFGMSAVALSCVAIAILTGAALIGREFEKRTIHVVLARPVTRTHFVLGKFLGLGAVLLLNWFLISTAYLGLLYLVSDSNAVFSGALFSGLFLSWLQALVIAGVAIFFSTFSTTSLSVVFTIGVFLIGNNVSAIQRLADKAGSDGTRVFLTILARLLPNLEHFNLGSAITYGLPVTASFVLTSVAYSFAAVSLLLLLSGLLLNRREVS